VIFMVWDCKFKMQSSESRFRIMGPGCLDYGLKLGIRVQGAGFE